MKTYKIADIQGMHCVVDDIRDIEKKMSELISKINESVRDGEIVYLDFENVEPKIMFSALGKLAYYVFYVWSSSKVVITNISTTTMDYFISSVTLYNEKERKSNQAIMDALRAYFEA